MLSHHPECKYFKDHYFILRDIKLCKGCFLGIPAFLITTLLLLLSLRLATSQIYLFAGIFLILTNIANIMRLSEKFPYVKIMTKICMGTGLGFILVGIFALEIHLTIKIFLFLNMYGTINSIFGLYRMNNLQKVCRTCKYKANWKQCDGFKEIYQRLRDHGFIREK